MGKKPASNLQNLLKQINETIKIIKNHKGPIEMTPDLADDIKKLESVVSQFKTKNEELINLFAETKELDEALNDTSAFNTTEEMIEDKLMQLLSKKMEKKKEEISDAQQLHEKRRKKERRKMFKTIGGDQKWIPL